MNTAHMATALHIYIYIYIYMSLPRRKNCISCYLEGNRDYLLFIELNPKRDSWELTFSPAVRQICPRDGALLQTVK